MAAGTKVSKELEYGGTVDVGVVVVVCEAAEMMVVVVVVVVVTVLVINRAETKVVVVENVENVSISEFASVVVVVGDLVK